MATYVMSDIHGCYDEFCQMLNLIEFSDKDFMYILGDILDRGPKSYEVYNKVKNSKNICLLQGNHEKMLVDAVENKIDYWERNGRYQTEKSFYKNTASWDFLGEVHDYFQNLPLWKELKIGGKKILLVHAGVNYSLPLQSQDWQTLTWIREPFLNYDKKYMDYDYIIHGHTPNFLPPLNIYGIDYHPYRICIDGGVFCGGVLNCLRLDDMQSFQVNGKRYY